MRNFAKKKYEAGTACSLLQVSAGIGLTAVTSTWCFFFEYLKPLACESQRFFLKKSYDYRYEEVSINGGSHDDGYNGRQGSEDPNG